jgi:hypothetical protein
MVSLKGQPGLREEYLLKDDEDIERYLSLPMPEISGDIISFIKQRDEVGDAGIVDICLGMNPAGATVQLIGSENFAMMSITSRELIYKLCERRMEIIKKSIEFCQDNRLGPFFSMLGQEYVVPPLHGPKDFWDFNVNFDKKLIVSVSASPYIRGKGKECLQQYKAMIDTVWEFGK